MISKFIKSGVKLLPWVNKLKNLTDLLPIKDVRNEYEKELFPIKSIKVNFSFEPSFKENIRLTLSSEYLSYFTFTVVSTKPLDK